MQVELPKWVNSNYDKYHALLAVSETDTEIPQSEAVSTIKWLVQVSTSVIAAYAFIVLVLLTFG